MKIFDVKYKTANEIHRKINTNSSTLVCEVKIDENCNSGNKIGFEDIMEVLGSFNQEGLGPIKWWQ